jgi:hypothetical protein
MIEELPTSFYNERGTETGEIDVSDVDTIHVRADGYVEISEVN